MQTETDSTQLFRTSSFVVSRNSIVSGLVYVVFIVRSLLRHCFFVNPVNRLVALQKALYNLAPKRQIHD